MIDWKLVRAFIAVMDEGTLSGAAVRLGATQPTIGRQIRSLELAAGDTLFIRRGLRLEPTENAVALLPKAREIENDLISLGRSIKNLGQDNPRTKITLTAPTLLCDELLPGIMPNVNSLVPGTNFDIIPSDSLEDIHRRSVDIALRMIKPTQPSLVVRKLATVSVGLYASADYVELRGEPSSPTDLAKHDLILPRNDEQLLLGMKRLGLDSNRLNVVAMTDDLRTRLAFVRAGRGISSCHDWIAAGDRLLRQILPDLTLASLDLWLVATDDLKRSHTLRLVYDQLAKSVKQALK